MSTTLRSATLPDGRLVDLRLEAGRIAAIGPAPTDENATPDARPTPSAAFRAALSPWRPDEEVDLGGALVLPALVNGHAHLDKTFAGTAWRPHRPGRTVRERVAVELEERDRLDETVLERGASLAERMIRLGTGTVRSHVDVDPGNGLAALEQVLALRERFRGRLDIQVVAFPQRGILASPGVAGLLDQAARAGADVIGGLDPIGFDADASAHLDTVFGTAERHGTAIDIHLHDLGRDAFEQCTLIAERTRALGLEGRVAISHAYGLGTLPPEQLDRIAEILAAARVAVMTNGPAGPMPPVAALRGAGVTVFAGSDNIRDAWSPFGDGDMLAISRRIAEQSAFATDDELEAALDLSTHAAATALGLEDYGLRPGDRADLLIVDSACPAEAVASPPPARLTLHRGRPVGGMTTEEWSAYPGSGA